MTTRNQRNENINEPDLNSEDQSNEEDNFSLGLNGDLGEDFAAELQTQPQPNTTNNADNNADPNANPAQQAPVPASSSTNTPFEPPQAQPGGYPYQFYPQSTPFNPRRRSFFTRPPTNNPSQPPFGSYPPPPPFPPFQPNPSSNPNPPVPPFVRPFTTPRTTNTTTSTTFSSRYNTVSRSEDEMLHITPIVAKEQRVSLDNKALQHLRLLATTAPPNTIFILPDPKADDEILTRTQTIANLLDNLRRHLQKFDMLDCFRLVVPTQLDHQGNVIGPHLYLDPHNNIVTIDLIKNYANLDEPQVVTSVTYLRKYGRDFDIENVDWFQELMINVCDPILSSKINERLTGYSIKNQGGPLFLYLMLQLIISTSEVASKALITRLDNLKIYQIEGENVLNVVSLVRKALERLELVHQVPENILDRLLDIFQTSSVKDFNSLFAAMKMQKTIDERFYVNRFTPEIIFETAQIAYTNFHESNKWVGFAQDQATFFTCHRCGKEGHFAAKCPQNTKTTKQSNKNQPTNTENKTYPRDDPIWTTPPKDGCRSKMINGKLRYWCHHHGWNQKHGTVDCKGPKKGARNADADKNKNKNKNEQNKSAKANVAQKDATKPTPSSSSNSTLPTQPNTQEPPSPASSVQFSQPMAPPPNFYAGPPDFIPSEPQPYPGSFSSTSNPNPHYFRRWW